MSSRIRVAAKGLALLMAVLVLTGVLYEQTGERTDRKRYPRIGRSVDIGGRSLNIYCSGDGNPTVILESAGHTAGYSWIDIQPEVAKLTRACWYDRAGYGWSDAGPLSANLQDDRQRPPRTSACRGCSRPLRACRRDCRGFTHPMRTCLHMSRST
jgi:hypothetical protein